MGLRGRKRQWTEQVLADLAPGTKARMKAAMDEGESRAEFLRGAIEAELARRKGLSPERVSAIQRQLMETVRQAVASAIADEKRPGGSLA